MIIDMDVEAMNMMNMNYVQQWYNKVLDGYKPGEIKSLYYTAGRRAGKSMLNQIYNTNLCNEILMPMMPESKYKFSRAKWYVAEFNWKDYGKVDKWCEQHFGPHPSRPDAWSRWVHKYSEKIHFRDEKDYVLFMLRWS